MWFLPEGQLPESPEKDGDQPDGIEAVPVPVRRRIQFWLMSGSTKLEICLDICLNMVPYVPFSNSHCRLKLLKDPLSRWEWLHIVVVAKPHVAVCTRLR